MNSSLKGARTLLSAVLFFASFSATQIQAQDSATLAADLKAADPAHWPAIESLLLAQRAELTAAHRATLAAAAATARDHETLLHDALNAKEAELAAAKATLEKTIADTAEVLKKIQDAKAAELTTGAGPRYQTLAAGEALIKPIITEAQKSELEKQLDVAKAAEAAAVKARKEAEAKLSGN